MPVATLAARVFAGAWLALLLPAAAPPQQNDPAPFAPGETLTYQITWSAFTAGEVVATLQRPAAGDGEYQVDTTARSRGFVSLLYNLNDVFHTAFDPSTLCARQITKTVNEGRRHKQTRIMFDAAQKLAILDETDLSKPGMPPKHAENAIPACVQDPVTAFYFMRRQPLRVGEQVRVPINDGAKTTEVEAVVQAREQIDTPLGKRFAFRVEPKVFGNLYKRKGRMLIWFSDDAARLPLRIKAMISVGTLTGTLQSVATARPVATPSEPRAKNPSSSP